MKMRQLVALLLVLVALRTKAGHIQLPADTSGLSCQSLFEPAFTQHVGKLVKIHGAYPENTVSTISEFSASWKTRGAASWHSVHHYPSFGFSLIHAQFGNSDTLGYTLGVIPFIEKEYDSRGGKIGIKAGLGIGWFSNPYDAAINDGNLVLGSRFANISTFQIHRFIALGRRVHLKLGGSYTHCSNAHMRVPNIGANIIALSCGLIWRTNPEVRNRHAQYAEVRPVQAHWRPFAQVIFGLHEAQGTVRPVGGRLYNVYGLSAGASRLASSGNGRISAGVICSYYQFYHDYILTQELFPADEALRRSASINLFAGREWIYGKFGLFLQAGLNVYAPFVNELDKVWDLPKLGWLGRHTGNRFGYRYYPAGYGRESGMPYVGVAVKTNGGTAEYLEFSTGFIF
jgi:hypothetical protein